MSDTIISRPLPRRPETGLLAWQATIGYISAEYSPDALLVMRVRPAPESAPVWMAGVTWGDEREAVHGKPSIAAALRDLWLEVTKSHQLLKTLEAAARQPLNYPDDRWLDPDTQAALDRLIAVTGTVFGTDWQLLFMYHAVSAPDARVQARLLAKEQSIRIGGRGATLRDACRDLYHNAAGHFVGAGRAADDLLL